jgi:hypothetical protein
MSAATTSDYSITVRNSSTMRFNFFAYHCRGSMHLTRWSSDSRPLDPGGEVCLAWSQPRETSSRTPYSALFYSPACDPARVWGIQLTCHTPSGGRPMTLLQYSPADCNELNSWLDLGKVWDETYSFIVARETTSFKITVSPDSHRDRKKPVCQRLHSFRMMC